MGDRRRLTRIGGVPLLMLIASAGCSIGDTMHVTRGVAPANVDRTVRFRTTYFFRTFDYCWNEAAASDWRAPSTEVGYRDVIPETDTIYRYRMTGKASALFNQVRFESGTLSRTQIDPFGAGVAYDAEKRAFRVGGVAAASEAEAALAALKAEVAALRAKVDAPAAPAPADALTPRVNELEAAVKALAASPLKDRCRLNGGAIRRGFQVMGPEGIRTFDQDERLVMAMSSSAKPLIATIQEYSGRILNERGGDAALLGLTRENLKIVEASRAVERTATPTAAGVKRSATEVFDAAIAAFGEK